MSNAEFEQIEKIVQSHVLHGSESLCKLLRYLAEKAVEQPGVHVKEYQIATEVFGRSGKFDPRLDSTVRVQTGRLRSKLAEYYASEGVADPLIVEIPKGAYLVTFAIRDQASSSAEHPVGAAPADIHPEQAGHPRNQWRIATFTLAGFLLASIATIPVLLVTKAKPGATSAIQKSAPPALRAFWRVLADDAEEPLVVFSNAAFVGRPETGLRYFNPARDSKVTILDHYTGVGEVLGVHELDRAFTLLQHGMRLKRGQLLSLDDVKNNNVIFIGSPSENLTLREIPGTHDFVFRTFPDGRRKGDLAIFDLHPQKGEKPYYLATPERPLVDDYALIGLAPGINPTHWVMILAGTTTIGTQAAVEYVCHANTLETLMKQLRKWKPGIPFEAVVHVKVTRGVPVDSDLIAAHVSP